MGDVFLANDSRLNRRVAIKCLKNEAPTALKRRLTTEAKLLAQLDSEYIVKIYDVMEHDDQLYLVMEYVDGVTLNEWLKNHTPDLQQVLKFSQQILKALQAAHQAGIIHRDLKADNVLIFQDERLKLTDFGIAKSLSSDFTEHTGEGRIIGSYAAMSPEQAMNKTLDWRSDFFSFGLLLYRLTTGHSAFGDSANPIPLIDRMLNAQPIAIDQYRPDCPPELRSLIRQLLEKSPAKRPANVQTILDMLSASIGMAKGTSTATQATLPTLVSKTFIKRTRQWLSLPVLVLVCLMTIVGWFVYLKPLENHPALFIEPVQVQSTSLADAEQQLLNMAIFHSLHELAIESNRFDVIEDAEWQPLNEQSNRAYAVAANQILRTQVQCREYNCEITLKLISTPDNLLLKTEKLNLLSDNLLEFKQSLMLSVDKLLPGTATRDSLSAIDNQAYTEFLQLELQARDRGNSPELLVQAKKLVGRSPFYLPVYLSYNRLCLNHFWDTLDKSQLTDCEVSLNQALTFSEDDYQLAFAKFELMLAKGDLVEAKEWLSRLQLKHSGNSRILAAEAEWYFDSGDTSHALESIDKAIKSRETWLVLYKKARFLWQNNQSLEALNTLQKVLQRVPGNFTALRLKATIHSYRGEFAEAASVYQFLIDHNQENTALLNDLGTSLIYSGQYSRAIEILEQAFKLDNSDPYITLNLADSFSLNQQAEFANKWYQKTVELSQSSHQDIRLYAVVAQAHAQLKNIREAIYALQKFQKLNSNEAETAYFSALVYALIGDHHSAEVNRLRAIELGVSPSWFQLLWFEISSDKKSEASS